jgi:hypothetical protein
MRKAANGEVGTAFAERADRWHLDPLENERGGRLTVDRVAIVRIACVAAETGARMQRDGLSADPVGWMLEPLALFEGRPPIEACMERDGCSKAILVHGLGLDLDPEPAIVDRMLHKTSLELEPDRD